MSELVFATSGNYPSIATTAKRSAAQRWGPRFVMFILAVWAAAFVVGFSNALATLTLAGFAAAILGIRKPALGLFGIGILCTIDPLTRHFLMTGGLLRWNTFNYWLLAISALALPMLISRRDPHTRLALLFVLLLALEIGTSPARNAGVFHVLNLSALFGVTVYFIRAAREPDNWYWLGIIVGTLGAAGGAAYFLQMRSLPGINANAWSYFPNAAIFGLCLAAPFARGRRGHLPIWLLAVINACWVFLSGSRGSMLVSSFALLFLMVQTRTQLHRRFVQFAVAGLLGLVVLTQFSDLYDRAMYRAGKLLDSSRTVANRTSGRSVLATDAWRIFVAHPFGVGTGAFPYERAKMTQQQGNSYQAGAMRQAHSGWCKTLAENGIPGLVLHLTYVLSFAAVGWRKRHLGLLPLGLLATGSLGIAYIATEFQAKGLWLLAAAVTSLLHSDVYPNRLPIKTCRIAANTVYPHRSVGGA